MTTPSTAPSIEAKETATWINHLPEAFGIREKVRQSPYRWCAREATLWGIATGTFMSLHRFRMNSTPLFAVNVGFFTALLVSIPSYYFCYRTRDHKEHLIEVMMKANQFDPASAMPEEVPAGPDHPFLEQQSDSSQNDRRKQLLANKEYAGRLPERKEWQSQVPQQDVGDVFVEQRPPKK